MKGKLFVRNGSMKMRLSNGEQFSSLPSEKLKDFKDRMYFYVEIEHKDELVAIQTFHLGGVRRMQTPKLERIYPLLDPGAEKDMVRIVLLENNIEPNEEEPFGVRDMEVTDAEILE